MCWRMRFVSASGIRATATEHNTADSSRQSVLIPGPVPARLSTRSETSPRSQEFFSQLPLTKQY